MTPTNKQINEWWNQLTSSQRNEIRAYYGIDENSDDSLSIIGLYEAYKLFA